MENEIQPLEPQIEPDLNNTNDQGLLPNGEIDHEGAMAKADLFKLGQYSYKLFKKLEDDQQLEAWVQAKITKAADYIASVYHYLEYEMKISEYGAKLENSDMYSESQKAEIRNKLSEAKDTIRALKIAQAEKLSESKSTKAKKDWDKDGKIESEKDEVIGSRRRAAGLDKKQKCIKETSEEEFQLKNVFDKHDDRTSKYGIPTAKDGKYAVKPKNKKETKKPEKVKESAPSADLTKKEKSAVVKKAKAGKDIGKPGKGFEKVANKATKKYGSKEKGEKVAAAAMWKNIKESIEHSFGEGIYSSETQQTEDLANDIAKLNKPDKFAPVKPENIKADRMASQGYPDLDQAGKSVEQSIAGLQKTHPKLYAHIQKNPALIDKIKAKPSIFLDLLTKPEFQPTFEDQSSDRDFSAKNVGKAVGNVVQGVKNTANAISGAYDSAKTAVSDFEKGYDSSTKPTSAAKPTKQVQETSELDSIKKLSGL
jgi:hypothetical protein